MPEQGRFQTEFGSEENTLQSAALRSSISAHRRKFKGAWASYEAPGVEPAFTGPRATELVLGYARGRVGGRAGEIRVYDNVGAAIEEWSRGGERHRQREASGREPD